MNAASVEADAKSVPRERSFLDRFLAALPIVGLALLVLSFYLVEASTRKTPWLFTDELEWSQLSRGIASTGHAARRGEPIFFKSIYAYAIAPLWWIHSTHTAYNGIKYLNAVLMTLAAVPTYYLARMLVSRRAAITAGLLAVAIPGMSYIGSIVPESLAYSWFVLTSWLIVRALTTRRLRDVALALAVSGAAVFVKSELELGLAAFVIAAAALWVTGPRGRALRAHWTRGDNLGAIVLLIGAAFLFNRVVLQHIHTWQIATQYWKSRMIDLGLTAGAALAVGLGLLPVIAGFVSLRLPDRRGQPAYRAFAAYLAASIVCFSLYTAGKAAYLSTTFASLTEERNLIYLSPLLLVATMLVFESRRIDWRILAAATAFVLFLVLTKPLDLGYPYFEAPGLSILAAANRHFHWGVPQLHRALVVAVAVGVILLAVRRFRGVAALASVLLLGWLLTGEIAATGGDNSAANNLNAGLPKPPDSIDRITQGRHVTVLGQLLNIDPNGLWSAEFWNRSIDHVDDTDGRAPGPGPTATANLASLDGTLSNFTGDPYVLAGPGIALQGTVVGIWAGFILYHIDGPWKLLDSAQQIYSDGWAPGWAAYTYFARHGPGTLLVDVRRTGYKGDAPPGDVVIHVGTVRLDESQSPRIGHLEAVVKTVIHNDEDLPVRIPITSTPVRAVVQISPTFMPSSSDTRQLGAQLTFTFCPDRGTAPSACR